MAGENPVAGSGNPPRPSIKQSAFRITSNKKKERYINILIYGDYGVGKTTLAASSVCVPEMRDVLLGNVESGDMSIEDDLFEGLDTVDIQSYRQFARLYEFLRLHCRYRDTNDERALRALEEQFRGEPVETPRRYRTVIIDSLTEVQKLAMYQLLGITVGEHPLDVEPESPQFKEWGSSAEMIRLLVRSFRDLPMHTIFVCSQSVDTDDKKKRFITPALPGKLANEVQGFLDVVGYYVAAPNESGEIKRRLYLQPGKTFQAKNRFPKFHGTYIDDPTMEKLLDLHKGATA